MRWDSQKDSDRNCRHISLRKHTNEKKERKYFKSGKKDKTRLTAIIASSWRMVPKGDEGKLLNRFETEKRHVETTRKLGHKKRKDTEV